jgi:predicted  nucleic acid-binding Zn-ribbon protein
MNIKITDLTIHQDRGNVEFEATVTGHGVASDPEIKRIVEAQMMSWETHKELRKKISEQENYIAELEDHPVVKTKRELEARIRNMDDEIRVLNGVVEDTKREMNHKLLVANDRYLDSKGRVRALEQILAERDSTITAMSVDLAIHEDGKVAAVECIEDTISKWQKVVEEKNAEIEEWRKKYYESKSSILFQSDVIEKKDRDINDLNIEISGLHREIHALNDKLEEALAMSHSAKVEDLEDEIKKLRNVIRILEFGLESMLDEVREENDEEI